MPNNFDNYDEDLFIFWYIHRRCNYNCSYCYEQYDLDKSEILPSVNAIDRVINGILPKLNNRNIIISLIGGEITLYKNLIYLLDKLNSIDNIKQIHINTNGSNEMDFYSDKIRINYTIHLSQINHVMTLPINDILYPKIVYNRSQESIHYTIMYEPQYVEKIQELLNVKRMNIKRIRRRDGTLQPLNDPNIRKYQDIIDKYGLEDRYKRYTSYIFKYCTTGNQLRFDYDGKVYYTDYKCKEMDNVNIYINPRDLELNYSYFECPHIICNGHNNCLRNIYKSLSMEDIQNYIKTNKFIGEN